MTEEEIAVSWLERTRNGDSATALGYCILSQMLQAVQQRQEYVGLIEQVGFFVEPYLTYSPWLRGEIDMFEALALRIDALAPQGPPSVARRKVALARYLDRLIANVPIALHARDLEQQSVGLARVAAYVRACEDTFAKEEAAASGQQ